jgi:tetratricopeptide (TPR) repeat protein
MTKTITFVVVIFLLTNLSAQKGSDSLRQLLNRAQDDTSRIDVLNQLGAIYAESKPDSTLQYGNAALTLSKRIHYEKGEIEAIHNLAVAFLFAGDYPKALKYSLDALKKSEALNDPELIASGLGAIGLVYGVNGDDRQAVDYMLRSENIYEELHDDVNAGSTMINVGVGFSRLNQWDSARFYLNKGLEISLKMKSDADIAAAYLNLGRTYAKMKQYDIAKAYFHQALPAFKSDNNYLFLYSTCYFIGVAFDSTSRYDSALYYGRLSLHYANIMASPVSLEEITKQLSSLFKKSGRLDSALFYLEIAMNAKDSLRSREKEMKIQALTFNEQLRQMEIAEQKRKEAQARVRNLELSGIAIFIPTFFFLVLLLGKRKVRSRTVEFLGVLSLLFFFEFIVLLVHPYIGSWTHESQIWMLLILVAIAVIPSDGKMDEREINSTAPREIATRYSRSTFA